MADVTQELALDTNWTDVTTGLGLADGETYGVDLVGAESNAVAFWAVTDSIVAPTVHGHPVLPSDRFQPVDAREVMQMAGQYLWMRVNRGVAALSVTRE